MFNCSLILPKRYAGLFAPKVASMEGSMPVLVMGGAKGSAIWAANGINSFLMARLVEGITSTSKMKSGRCQCTEN
jgi:hypothetical protein